MTTVLITVAILVGIAIICAVLLTVASIYFGVKEDETAVAIRERLPGAN
jgi:Na+-translocating ferredoxin:NAD+ oxidoreductase RNF subunit RnfB